MMAALMSDLPDMPKKRPWYVPPEEGFHAEDLDRIPELPPHTELIDGSLVFACAGPAEIPGRPSRRTRVWWLRSRSRTTSSRARRRTT